MAVDVVGDEIVGVFHTGGVERDGVVVDTYAILLKSGRCIQLTEHGIAAANPQGMRPDPMFDRFFGMVIVGVETSEDWPTCGLRLGNGSALVMGSPAPYYWGLYEEVAPDRRDLQ